MVEANQGILDKIASFWDALLLFVFSQSFWLQFSIVVACVAIAILVHRRYVIFLRRVVGDQLIAKVWWHILLRGSQRLIFPLLVLLLLVLVKTVFVELSQPTLLLDFLVPLMISLALVRVTVFILHRSFRPTPAIRAWENIISTVIWLGVALYLLDWLPAVIELMDSVAFSFGSTRVSLLSAAKLFITLAGFLLLALWLSNVIENRLMSSKYLASGVKVGVAKFSRVLFVVVGVAVALNSVGIDLTALAVFSGALGVGLGFGLQKIASNFISGFILVLDRSIRPNDVITVGDSFGWVQSLKARYVVILDRDGIERLIPNEQLVTSEVINWSYSNRRIRLKLPVQISYENDPKQAMELLVACANHERVLDFPKPVARLVGFGDSGINLELRVWIRDPESGVRNVSSDINLAIWQAFKDNGITIPYPQRDVHLVKTPNE